jgi:uncharacterized protein YegJ (DUF2314 family)
MNVIKTLAGLAFMAALITAMAWWYLQRTTSAGALPGSRPEHSVVLLRKTPFPLDLARVSEAVARAWGDSAWPGALTEEPEIVDLLGGFPMVSLPIRGATFFLTPDGTNYFTHSEATAGQPAEVVRLMTDHRAHLTINLLGAPPPGTTPKHVHDALARLAAELLDDDTIGFMFPDLGILAPVGAETANYLRSGALVPEAGGSAPGATVQVAPDDREMVAATAQARAELPQFIQRFRVKDGLRFSVKVPLRAGAEVEHAWMEVRAIDDHTVVGVLDNDVGLPGYRSGQELKRPTAEIEDWIVLTNLKDQSFDGGYTAKVLLSR